MAPRNILKQHHELIVQRIAEGKSTRQIAKELNHPQNSITAYCSVRRIYGEGFIQRRELQKPVRILEEEFKPQAEPPPAPRPSMYSLAEFDPVIRRALAQRLRQRGERYYPPA